MYHVVLSVDRVLLQFVSYVDKLVFSFAEHGSRLSLYVSAFFCDHTLVKVVRLEGQVLPAGAPYRRTPSLTGGVEETSQFDMPASLQKVSSSGAWRG
jgi:hypothetical protein